MIKLWIKDTNFYSVVLKKEAERRQEQAELAAQTGQKPFVDVLKEQSKKFAAVVRDNVK